ncbi:hypothetical protein VNO78_02883 [Psophocarpus tetragonolobus]|uniref:Uncharacterized protein n=1 Tax=Psophocarpus tetragonolobus TaxID=3891 RepID=A0AAN9XV39_PSOTE
MGTSREIAIGHVIVVSLLLSSMKEKLVDPVANPMGYTKLILLTIASPFQTSFGLLRNQLKLSVQHFRYSQPHTYYTI